MNAPRVEERLPLATILIYALPAASLGFMGALVSIYLLKFSTDVLLIAPGLMGLLFGLSRLWDAVSDPLAGYWSDRTRSALGRRRPWLLAAALPLALLFAALWSPPAALGPTALTIWMGAAIVLYFTAQTAVGIPHMALGAELTNGYHERSRVFGARMLFEFVGIFLAACAIILAGAVLQVAGFAPNAVQNETAQLSIRLLMSGVPCVLFLVKALILLRFRLNSDEHAEIRAALDARAA
jgi:GPH family glycoside/pentoside/hexuronide:cation symporter